MSQSITIRAKGLYLTGSDFQAPEGALAQADNVVISRDGVIETRRGMASVATKSLRRLFPYKNAIIGHNGTSTLSRSANYGATWTDYTAAVTPPSGYPERGVEAKSCLFLTDATRIRRIDTLTSEPEAAGVPGGLDLSLSTASESGTAVPPDSQVAYRVVFGKKDANGRLILGVPSSAAIFKNPAVGTTTTTTTSTTTTTTAAPAPSGTKDVLVAFTLPAGLTSAHFVQGYRTVSSSAENIDPGDEMGLCYESPIPVAKAVTALARSSNVVTVYCVSHGYSIGMTVNIADGGTGTGGSVFTAGNYVVSGITDAHHFTVPSNGTDGALTVATTATPIAGVFTDTVPDGFLGAALYTNENQEGILSANERPPLARELAAFRSCLFAANLTNPAQAILYLLATGGTNGVGIGTSVTVNGVTFVGDVAEDVSNRYFQVFWPGSYTPYSIANAIRDTAMSLLRVVNRDGTTGATGIYLSGENDAPGQIQFTNTAPTGNLTFSSSRPTAWSPTTATESPKTYKNGIVWSKPDQPDHFQRAQILAPALVGSDDEEILRVIPTRSAAFILKKDGLWRITGEAGQFSIDPFDPTIHILAPEAAVALDNTIFALADQGVVRISDTGVAVVSRPIETALTALLDQAERANTATYAFGVAYESDRKYLLWLPNGGYPFNGQAFVFDMFTGAWTRRTDAYCHAIVDPYSNQMYAAGSTKVYRERTGVGYELYADSTTAVTISSGAGTSSLVLADATGVGVGDAIYQSGVFGVVTAKDGNTVTLDRAAALTNGAATSYAAIPTVVKWAPKFGDSPGLLSELQEVALFWEIVYFANATLAFSTNLSPDEETVALAGSAYGWTGASVEQMELRAWPPREKSWGSQFNISLSHAQALCRNAIQGLQVVYASPSTVVSR